MTKKRIELISDEIITIVSSITTIEKTYDYPVMKLGRQLPALVVLYDGFSQGKEVINQTGTNWNFIFFLYLSAEGRTLESVWNRMVDLVPQILDEFRDNQGLNGTVWGSNIDTGQVIMAEVGDTKVLGHEFNLTANKTET